MKSIAGIMRHPLRLLPFGVFGLSLATTGVMWWLVSQSIRQKAYSVYTDRTSEIVERISKRLHDHEQVLRGVAGLFSAKQEVSRTEWRRYVDALQLEEDHPGILGLGFAARMTPAEKEANTKTIRAEGFPDYRVVPEGDRETYAPLIYVEPFNWRNQRAFGYDLYAEPVRRAALDQARDQGTFTISGAVTLVPETDRGKQSGILTLFPVYRRSMPADTVEQRRAALQGFVCSPIRMKDFVYATLGNPPDDLAFEIFDGKSAAPDRRTFSSLESEGISLPPGYRPAFSSVSGFTIHGRSWTISFRTLPQFDPQFHSVNKTLALSSGAAVSLLLAWIAFMLQSTRDRALALAGKMTAGLRESEQRLAAMAAATPARTAFSAASG